MNMLNCAAVHLNNFRVVPRIVLLWLLRIVWVATMKVLEHEHVTSEDVALLALFTGLFVVTFKFYLDNSGPIMPTDGKPQEPRL